MKKKTSFFCGLLAALFLSLTLLALILSILGTSAPLMTHMMRTFAPSASTGLPDAHYPAMAEMITGCLAGRTETFQFTWTEGEVTYIAFRDYEQQHMADCLGLFRLCRQVLACAAAGLTFSLGLAVFLRERRQVCRGFLWGGCGALAMAGALILWGVLDFDGLFVLFHQLSFDNGLWLLNPQTDLLIRLMPLSFFITYAAVLGAGWLVGMTAALLLARRMKNR